MGESSLQRSWWSASSTNFFSLKRTHWLFIITFMWGGIKSFCSKCFNVSAWGLGADKKNTHTPLTHTAAKFCVGGGLFSVLPNWSSGRVLDWIISPCSPGWLEKSLTFCMWPPPCVFLKPPSGPRTYFFIFISLPVCSSIWFLGWSKSHPLAFCICFPIYQECPSFIHQWYQWTWCFSLAILGQESKLPNDFYFLGELFVIYLQIYLRNFENNLGWIALISAKTIHFCEILKNEMKTKVYFERK